MEYPPLVYAAEHDRRQLSRDARRGRLRRLGQGIYTSDLTAEPEQVVHARLWEIVAHELPGAVIADRSARDGGMPHDGCLFVISDRSRPLLLPGVTVRPRPGVGALPGDLALPGGLHLAGEARTLLENLVPRRRNATGGSRTLNRDEIEAWLDALCAARGEPGLNRLRDQARALAPLLDRHRERDLLDALIAAALGTRPNTTLHTPELRARSAGAAFDQPRLAVLTRFAAALRDRAPEVLPALAADAGRRALLPFYEAYFSNYIEGTEFTLDEAADIIFHQVLPPQRPADAHDILGTYRLAADPGEMGRTPTDPDELVQVLRHRHAVLLGGRPELDPGQFKRRANRAGSTEFVAPDLVEGTLRRGFEAGEELTSPFARAVYLMFLVSEVHPFADGNGRVARLMMNAELVRVGEVRIIVPTVFRLNYLAALKATTHTANDEALPAALSFARRWSARVDFTDRVTSERDLSRTNATRDAREAEDAGVRLTLT